MPIHPLAAEIHATGRTLLPDGSTFAADSYIPESECALIDRSIAACGATTAVETGMAFGVSSLCIADALAANARASARTPHLISIDPAQTSSYRGAGRYLIERAGYGALLEVIEEPSQTALPALVAKGRRVGFGFIDGWHTFDHTLIDFFFIDQLLERGGMIVFDDVGYSAIHRVVEFVLANRDYELVEALRHVLPPKNIRLRRAVKRLLRPLARTDRDPSASNQRLFRRIENCHSVALRKRGDDTRRFDHFVSF